MKLENSSVHSTARRSFYVFILLSVLCINLASASLHAATYAEEAELTITKEPRSHDVRKKPLPKTELPTSWMYELLLNLACYATIFIPGYYLRQRYLARGGPGQEDRSQWSALQRLCFIGQPDISEVLQDPERQVSARKMQDPLAKLPRWMILLLCFVGLQLTFLTWGVLQEKILTRSYNGEHFTDAQFLVFTNRIIAFLLSGTYLLIMHHRQPPHRAPFYKYSFASFSNTMSSWFQYEALKYVSFPTQILAKASKIIPVMLMGKLVNNKTYPMYEYITAGMISFGMSIFLYSRWKAPENSVTLISSAAGASVLLGYMILDSFTSNWQDKLFQEYRMTKMQMMFGISTCSMILTIVSLIEQGGFVTGFGFAVRHPDFFVDILMLSFSAALGNIFIYMTIQQFGAVIFAVIMTVRQAIAVLLSCLIYGHSLSALGIFGVSLVFIALGCQAYAKQRRNQLSKPSGIQPSK
ncbi:adenosine 3'-phospho 5'-phosphosulfate transporter 1-like [Paramacrobiotus metropolitanus]|uniref:adenosine 3'-phospho 5'-phosphosulfate transporter 1-like n=1 Tax=Paramacrobiotus metropolitanus TaxID=2943436 RepID=UPI002445E591|nr:adenosine 3'-phospho 5'-phosphosulfate transporter 1-like [Paramacrobiotus metropolitanus]